MEMSASGWLAVGAASCLLAGLWGCEASRWEREFVPTGVAAAPLPETAPVRVREVPWDRVQATLAELAAEIAASDQHPDDWPADRKADHKARLLRGLQVDADPGTVDILGRSEFRTTGGENPRDGELVALARKVGATTVVWAGEYLGKADAIRQESATEFRSGSWSDPSEADSRRRSGSYSETATIFFPVVVRADEHAYLVYFLRER